MASFVVLVVGVKLRDVEECQQVSVNVAERQGFAFRNAVARRDGQDHRQGPECPIGQAHLTDDSLIVGFIEKCRERRESADGEELEIAQTALIERQAGKVLGGGFHLGGSFVADDQIDQRPAVRLVQPSGRGTGRRSLGRCRNRRSPCRVVGCQWQAGSFCLNDDSEIVIACSPRSRSYFVPVSEAASNDPLMG